MRGIMADFSTRRIVVKRKNFGQAFALKANRAKVQLKQADENYYENRIVSIN